MEMVPFLTNGGFPMFHRRFVFCLFIILASIVFNPQCFGQYDTSHHQRLHQQCPHGIYNRDRCRLCNAPAEAFDRGKNYGKDIRYSGSQLKARSGGRAGAIAVAVTGFAMALIVFADYAVIAGLGAVVFVVIVYFLGIFVGYHEDSIDDTASTVMMPEPSVRRRDVDAEAAADVDAISDVEAWIDRAQERNSHRQRERFFREMNRKTISLDGDGGALVNYFCEDDRNSDANLFSTEFEVFQ
jgi:hypothetical protein